MEPNNDLGIRHHLGDSSSGPEMIRKEPVTQFVIVGWNSTDQFHEEGDIRREDVFTRPTGILKRASSGKHLNLASSGRRIHHLEMCSSTVVKTVHNFLDAAAVLISSVMDEKEEIELLPRIIGGDFSREHFVG